MKIYRGREMRVNLDNYEHHQIAGGVSLDHQDLGYTQDDVAAMDDEALESLAAELQGEAERILSSMQLEELKALIPLAHRKSFVHEIFDAPEVTEDSSTNTTTARRPRRAPRKGN